MVDKLNLGEPFATHFNVFHSPWWPKFAPAAGSFGYGEPNTSAITPEKEEMKQLMDVLRVGRSQNRRNPDFDRKNTKP